jgi:predicted CopG family antitoxin
MTQDGKTIRISVEVYNKLLKIGKMDDTFTSLLERILEENELTAVVTET